VRDAAELLADRRIGAVVVSPDGPRSLGILSERDIVRELGKRGTDCLSEPVEQMMTRQISAARRPIGPTRCCAP
jgi:CBS domain-containing protein